MDPGGEFEAHEREQLALQASLYRRVSPEERLRLFQAGWRSMQRLRSGREVPERARALVERERDAAAERMALALDGPAS